MVGTTRERADPTWIRSSRMLAIAVLYVATAKLGFLLAAPPGNVTAVFPPSGIALAALLVWGRGTWPGIWLGSFVANTWFFSATPRLSAVELTVSASIGLASTLQALLGAALIRRFVGSCRPFARAGDVGRFAVIETVACATAATVGTASLCAGGFLPWDSFLRTWSTWYLGDLVGVLMLAPLLTTWSVRPSLRWKPVRILEGALLAGAVLAAGHLVYGAPLRAGAAAHSRDSLFLPLIVWAAVRFGQRGVTLTAVAASILAISESLAATGSFAGESPAALLWLQLFSGIVALTGLLLATSIAEFQHAEAELRAAQQHLEKRVAERTAALVEQGALLHGLFERAPDAILAVGGDGRVMRANERVAAVFGWRPEELVGQRIETLLPEEYREHHVRHRGAYAVRPHVRPMGAGLDLFGRRKDGTRFPVDIMLSPLDTAEGPMVIAIVRDITNRREREERLRRTGEQLRALAARVEETREEERARMAREVHDELGQALTGLKMELGFTAKLAASGTVAPGTVGERVRAMTALIDGMIDSVRRIASDLRPSVLDDLGLVAAIEWQAREFERRTGIACEVMGPAHEAGLDGEAATAVFRIFQEILTNVTRHAGGSHVAARLAIEDGEVLLEVRDDGRGIAPEEVAGGLSLGLLGMRERAALLGGKVDIAGVRGEGTTVRVQIPRAQAETST